METKHNEPGVLFDTRWGVPVDDAIFRRGCDLLAGVDEVGRGALAGPVVTAAVILDSRNPVGGIRDSKALTGSRREVLCEAIEKVSVACCVDFIGNEEVDFYNVLEATKISMKRAIGGLCPQPRFVLLDYVRLGEFHIPSWSLAHGDALSISVGAASIVAKVYRDRWMTGVAREFPGYGFDRNKGYGTKHHLQAIRELGPCPLHRKSFKPVSGRP